LVYYSSEHEHLENFFGVLRGKGLVDETTYNDLKRFRITERFARYLIEGR